ncbi:MAG: AMP-binding protein [Pseudomonadota bacterium]
MIFGDIIRRNAKRFPGKTALIFEETNYTFKELDERGNRLANGLLSLGLKKGDRITIVADNCHQYMEIFCALAKLGIASMAANPFFPIKDLFYAVKNIEADTVIFQPKYREIVSSLKGELRNLKHFIVMGDPEGNEIDYEKLILAHESKDPHVSVNEDDELLIVNTSGTTGLPKQIVHTHKSGLGIALNALFAHQVTPDDTGLIFMPMFWGAPIAYLAFSHYYVGGRCIIAAEMTAESFLRATERGQVNHTFIGTPFLIELMDHPNLGKYDTSTVRSIALSGTPLSIEILKRAIRVFGNVFGNMFGLSETGPVAYLKPEEVVTEGSPEELKRSQSCGRETINVDIRVVDDQGEELPPGALGEVIMKGDSVMKEYLKAPQATEQAIRDGWFYTGDMGIIDKDGYLYIQGRKKDMITTSGKTLIASEIEDIIYQEPSVKECAVVGMPDENIGEAIKAFIVIREGRDLTEEKVIDLCKENLPDFAVPGSVEFLSEFPKSAVGKILKYKLKNMHQ